MATSTHDQVVTLPRLGAVARQALPHVIEGSLLPALLFYVGLRLVGVTAAILIALTYAYAALAGRKVRSGEVPGMLAISAVMLTGRTVLALLTGSAFLYFLQPTLGGVLLAGAFAVSVPLGRPLIERLARDLVPIPAGVDDAPWLSSYFRTLSYVWAAANLANAGFSLWLLTTRSLDAFVLGRTAAAALCNAVALGISVALFVRTARRHDLAVVRG